MSGRVKEMPVAGVLRMVPLDRIDVLNSRERNEQVYETIVENIRDIGLKKPVTVTVRAGKDGEDRFLLICGEGRVNAFRKLGEKMIPALVVDVDDENAYVMSLVENIARRQYRPLELLSGIQHLLDSGYDRKAIARKTGLSLDYVQGILSLLKNGEERLLIAVQTGRVPLNTAIDIVGAGQNEEAVQSVLQDAYETGKLRGKKLLQVRRIIERRKSFGPAAKRSRGADRSPRVTMTPSSLVRSYQREVARQKQMVFKAEFVQQKLLFIVGALRELFRDENFTTLLRAEGLNTLPKFLAERVSKEGG